MHKQEWLSAYRDQLPPRELRLLSRAYDTLVGNTVDDPSAPWAPCRCISPWINETTGI